MPFTGEKIKKPKKQTDMVLLVSPKVGWAIALCLTPDVVPRVRRINRTTKQTKPC